MIFSATADFYTDLDVILDGPLGSSSTLASARAPIAGEERRGGKNEDRGSFFSKKRQGYEDWIFTTVRHWGENSCGKVKKGGGNRE